MSIRRRRKCESCGHRYTTYENIAIQLPAVVKTDGRREAFSRDKILYGLDKACQKRPISRADIDDLIDRVERYLCDLPGKEVPSQQVGEKVMQLLHKLDPVAYVRFASFYWKFDDINDFVKELGHQEGLSEGNHEQIQ